MKTLLLALFVTVMLKPYVPVITKPISQPTQGGPQGTIQPQPTSGGGYFD